MFLCLFGITLCHYVLGARRSAGASGTSRGTAHYRWQNGIAVAGDYMSAASFLGIAGIIAFQGLRRVPVFGRMAGRRT